MEITQVKVFPVNEDKLKAFVSVVFDHCFMVNDIKVIQGRDGLFLSMPSRRKRSGEFKDVAHPLNNETRRGLEERVLQEYRSVVDDETPRRPDRVEAGREDTEEGKPAPREIPASGGTEDPAPPRPTPIRPPAPAEAPAMVAREASAERDGEDPAPAGSDGKRTLEEIQELHLRDSFWSVT